MIETHDPSSSDAEAGSPRIPPGDDVLAVRSKGAHRTAPIPNAGRVEETDGMTLRDLELRELCCRLFGWSEEAAGVVDDAMQVLLRAACRRGSALPLRGASDLVPVAYALHRRLLGEELPFIVCDPRRCESTRRDEALLLPRASAAPECLGSRR